MATAVARAAGLSERPVATFADGLAVRVAIPYAVDVLNEVGHAHARASSEREIARGGRRLREGGIRAEGAAAAALAALPQLADSTARSSWSSPAGTSTRSCSSAAASGTCPLRRSSCVTGLSPGQASSRRGAAGGRCGRGGSRASRAPLALEAAVLVLDRDDVVVADGVERGDEARPAHLAEARQPRHLPADAARETCRGGRGRRGGSRDPSRARGRSGRRSRRRRARSRSAARRGATGRG